MPDIPVLPGVSVSPKGILNRPMKDVICGILFGGIHNMLNANLACLKGDLDKYIDEANAGAPSMKDLALDLKDLRAEVAAAEQTLGVKDMLGRINGAMHEVQSLMAMDGLCRIPLRAPPIPDVMSQVADMEFSEMNSILHDVGRLSKPQICLHGQGGVNTGNYRLGSIMDSLERHFKNLTNNPANSLMQLQRRLRRASAGLRASFNRQLFPDFRHKQDLTTGTKGPNSSVILASSAEQARLHANILGSDHINLAAWQKIANMPGATAAQISATYPPVNTPNLKDATALAQSLVSTVNKTGSYPMTVNGIQYQNAWPTILGPQMYSLAVQALTPEDPLFVQQDPVYDYCGKIVGQNSTVITGDPAYDGGSPLQDADLDPPISSYNIMWIADRNCWAVTGKTSEQTIQDSNGNTIRGTILNANPTIELRRNYNNILGIPSYDILGSTLAPELYICKVGADLKPITANGQVVLSNIGLNRIETNEVLVDANGTLGDDPVNGPDGVTRRQDNPLGSTLYFTTGHKIYYGDTAPILPDEDLWWQPTGELAAGNMYKWVPNLTQDGEGGGEWVLLTQQEIDDNFVGSSTNFNDPQVNYLAYSNKDGSVFGLIKLI